MPKRSRDRKFIPFAKLSRHKRRDAVVRLNWRIRHAAHEPGLSFWTDHYLVDPEDPNRKHGWIDIYFAGLDRCTLWNAEIITTKMAWNDEIRELAFNSAHEQLSASESKLEFSLNFKRTPRRRPNASRTCEWIKPPTISYPQFEGRSFRAECDRLEAHLRATKPMEVKESFTLDRGYAYGIGLHAVVADGHIDQAVVERTIARFQEIGEKDWIF